VVVVARRLPAVPRTRDPHETVSRRHNLASDVGAKLPPARAFRRRAEAAEGGVTVLSTGPRLERTQRGERAAEPGSTRRRPPATGEAGCG
jgi:hypothetical protein